MVVHTLIVSCVCAVARSCYVAGPLCHDWMAAPYACCGAVSHTPCSSPPRCSCCFPCPNLIGLPVNKPAGAIAPDAALLLSSILYCGCLIAACLMEPSRLRSIVAFSAAATLLYTPLFKKLTAIKNATVATVIALAPLAGALAAGAVSQEEEL